MRTPLTIAIGACVGAAAAGVVLLATERASPRVEVAPVVQESDAPRAVAAPIAPSPAVPAVAPPESVPTTPDYGPRRVESQAIYRCTTKAGTRYSNEPCAGGTVVDASSAVTGYDTRPSDRLARLVAADRVADAPLPPVYRTAPIHGAETDDCARMRRQIVDLDAATRQPGDAARLDELRAIRQDVRTSMVRLHC